MSDGGRLSKYEREDYLIKLKKEFSFAGASIPERICVDGEVVRLRALVFSIAKGKSTATPAELQEADRVAALVRKERNAIVKEIGSADGLTKAEADRLFMAAAGLGRALDTLDRAREPRTSVTEEAKKAKVQDGRRWLGLVKRIYGREHKRDGSR